jgi:hypothetical protein
VTTNMKTYKDKFTLDGRLRPGLGVSQKKVAAVRDLLEAHKHGDRIASAKLQEALTTSDAVFNLAYLANLNFVPNYDEADKQWRNVAGYRVVPDFRPATLYSLSRDWTDGNGGSNVLSDHGAAPTIAEGTPYPYAYIRGEASEGASIKKRGFKTDWTLESRINDGLGVLDELPSAMLDVSLDTEVADVYEALVGGGKGANSQLPATVIPGGSGTVTVPANAPLSRDAVIAAKVTLANRKVNGRNIQVNGGYNLVVPIGQGIYANYILNFLPTELRTNPAVGTNELVYQLSQYGTTTDVTIVESEWVTGTEWFLIPKPNATRRPVLERLGLRGYETPQLMVNDLSGQFVGGAKISPFEGSFDADVITLKLRQFGGGVVWDGGLGIVYSEGDGN